MTAMTPRPVQHYTGVFEEGDDGWWHVECACGWAQGSFQGADDAADAYGDHRAETA